MGAFPFACRWVLSRLDGAVAAVNKGMEAYEFSTATSVRPLAPLPVPPLAASAPCTCRLPTSAQRVPETRPSPLTYPPLQALYSFWQYDLCDVFIELMKPVMVLDDAGALPCPCCLPATHLAGQSQLDVSLRDGCGAPTLVRRALL